MYSEKDIMRFWNKVKKGQPTECWNWTGCRNGKRGEFLVDDQRYAAHRFSYLIHYKTLGKFKVVHTCNNLMCVNPKHLYGFDSLEKAFWFYVDKREDECWNWTGALHNRGYGTLRYKKTSYYAHRLSYQIHIEQIPQGSFICHRCDNARCVNPSHLFIGIAQDNSNDMVNKNRQCKGSNKRNAVLAADDVILMRNMHKTGDYSYAELAEIFGISRAHAWNVVNRRYWKHV